MITTWQQKDRRMSIMSPSERYEHAVTQREKEYLFQEWVAYGCDDEKENITFIEMGNLYKTED